MSRITNFVRVEAKHRQQLNGTPTNAAKCNALRRQCPSGCITAAFRVGGLRTARRTRSRQTRKANCLRFQVTAQNNRGKNLSSLHPPYSLFHGRIKEICASSTRCEVYSGNENLQVPLPRKLRQCKCSGALSTYFILHSVYIVIVIDFV